VKSELTQLHYQIQAERKRLEEKEQLFQMRFQMSNCFFQGFLYSQQMQSQIKQQLAETSAKPPSATIAPSKMPMYQGEQGG
jgi:hypothetical protein